MIPLLTLGIPGSASGGVILGAFLLHGIQPGPRFMVDETALAYSLFIGFFFTAIVMYFLGKYTTTMMASVLTLPNYVLVPVILIVSLIGAYVDSYSLFDVGLAIAVGVICFIIRKLDFSLAALILAFILASMMEENFRRALLVSGGDFAVFFTRNYSIAIWVIIFVLLVNTFFASYKKKKKAAQEENA